MSIKFQPVDNDMTPEELVEVVRKMHFDVTIDDVEHHNGSFWIEMNGRVQTGPGSLSELLDSRSKDNHVYRGAVDEAGAETWQPVSVYDFAAKHFPNEHPAWLDRLKAMTPEERERRGIRIYHHLKGGLRAAPRFKPEDVKFTNNVLGVAWTEKGEQS